MEQGEGRLMGLMKGKGDPDSEPVPGWWPQSKVWLSAECTLKDVKMSFFLFYPISSFYPFSSFSFYLISPFRSLSRQIVSG